MNEEKKAIETTKAILKEWQKIVDIEDPIERDIEMNCYSEEMPFSEMKTLLKIIEKQQKEVEDLKIRLQDTLSHQKNTLYFCIDDYVSKDKLREKIKAFQNIKKEIIKNDNELLRSSITYDIIRNDYCEKMLQELLEEN